MKERWLFRVVTAALAVALPLMVQVHAASIDPPTAAESVPRTAAPPPRPAPPRAEPASRAVTSAKPQAAIGAQPAGRADAAQNAPPPRAQKPATVSLDYCADQYVLALADRDQILALSPHAQSDVSHLGLTAQGIPRVRPTAEAVLALDPQLVVRQWGGGLGAAEMLARYGTPVVQVGVGQSLDSIRASVLALGQALGQPDRAQRLIDDMDRQVRTLNARHKEPKPVALYVTGSGASAGRGTLIDEMFAIAGVTNQLAARERAGWQTVDLEQIALSPPDVFVTAFFDNRSAGASHWTMGRHPLFARLLESRPTVQLRSDLVACPAWFMLDAAEEVARGTGDPASETAAPARPAVPLTHRAPVTVDPTPASLR
jgi:iron complex transport system substrate-binding protein